MKSIYNILPFKIKIYCQNTFNVNFGLVNRELDPRNNGVPEGKNVDFSKTYDVWSWDIIVWHNRNEVVLLSNVKS